MNLLNEMNLENQMKELILDNRKFINYNDITSEDLDVISNDKSVLLFDTENSPVFPKEIVDKYNLTNVDYKTIKDFQIPLKEEGKEETEDETIERHNKSLAVQLRRDKLISTKVYVWMLGSNLLEGKVFYGNEIGEFFDFINMISRRKKEKGQSSAHKIYCHNLGWDIEFIKYHFKDKDFKNIKKKVSKKGALEMVDKNPTFAFDITESDGIVYGSNIYLGKETYMFEGKKKNFVSKIEFIDSMKVTDLSLEKIAKNVVNIEPIYLKKKTNEYLSYNLVREGKWKPEDNIKEAFYCYTDIYILQKWYNQFVVPMYVDNGITSPHTISSISFALILKKSYENELLRNVMSTGTKKATDRSIYENHFDLRYIYNKEPMFGEYIDYTYQGGHTTASIKYKELSEKQKVSGVSFDICSSYPSQIVNKPLPFGRPRYEVGKYEDFEVGKEKYDFHFITIAFDGWSSKNPNNEFGLFCKMNGIKQELQQAYGKSKDEEEKELLDKLYKSSNDYFTSNIINGKAYGQRKQMFETSNNEDNSPELKCILKDKKRSKLLNKFKNRRYILSMTAKEFECWSKYYDFWCFDTNIKGRKVRTNKVDFIDYISFQSEIGHFKDGMLYYYGIKENSDNDAVVFNAKLICNSFYGKNASKTDRIYREFDLTNDIIGFRDSSEYEPVVSKDAKLYAKHFASAVTSYGRIQLMDTAHKIGCDKFIYADTDSLKFEMTKEELIAKVEEVNKDLPDNEKIIINGINSNKKILGTWDFEFEFDDIKVIGAKRYMYKKINKDGSISEFICKCAGLPENVRDTIKCKDDFVFGKEIIKSAKVKVIGGYLIMDCVFSLNEFFI